MSFRKEDTAAYVRQYSSEAFDLIEEISKSGRELEYNFRGGKQEYLTIIYLTCLLNFFPAEERNVRKGYAYSFTGRGDYDFQFLPFSIDADNLKEYYEDGEFRVGTIINDLIFISSSAAQIQVNRRLEASMESYNNFTEKTFPSLQAIPTELSSLDYGLYKDKVDKLRNRLLENTQWFTTAYLNFIRRVKSTTGRMLYQQSFEEREITEQFLFEAGAEFDDRLTNWELTYESYAISKYIKNPLEIFKDFKIKNTKVLDIRVKGDKYYSPTYYIEKYFAENPFGIGSSLGSLTTSNPLATNGYEAYDAGGSVFGTYPVFNRGNLSDPKYGQEEKITKEEAAKLVTSQKFYSKFIQRRDDDFKVLPKKGDIVALYNLPLILTYSYRDVALNSAAIAKAFPNYQSFKTGIDYIDNIYFENNNDVSASTIVESLYFKAMREINARNYYREVPFNAFEKCFAVITQVDTESFNVLTDTITCETLIPIGGGSYAIAEFKAAYYNDSFYSECLYYIESLDNLDNVLNPENDYSDYARLKLFINLVNTCQNNFIIPVNQADVFEEVNRNNKLKNIAGTWELKKAGGIVDVQEFVKTYKNVKVDALESQKILDKMFDRKYKDTEVYKYFSLNLGKLFDLYKADKKGTKEILNSLNALAKYEKECIVGGELPKKEKSQIRNLIDNI